MKNIRDLYHDIAKTIIREDRLRESETLCGKSKDRQGKSEETGAVRPTTDHQQR